MTKQSKSQKALESPEMSRCIFYEIVFGGEVEQQIFPEQSYNNIGRHCLLVCYLHPTMHHKPGIYLKHEACTWKLFLIKVGSDSDHKQTTLQVVWTCTDTTSSSISQYDCFGRLRIAPRVGTNQSSFLKNQIVTP